MPGAPGRIPFVGRQRELAELTQRLDAASQGRGGVVLIAGEPGIGKTRLAEEVAAQAKECGVWVLWGRCYEGEGAPAFWPWVQVLRTLLRGQEADAVRAALGPDAAALAQLLPELHTLLPDLPAPPALEPAQARFRLFEAVTTVLTRAAAARPLVLLLDDLHWADAPSLLLVEFLAQELTESNLLLVGTYRDIEVRRGQPLAATLGTLARRPQAARLTLRGLDAPAVAQVVAATTGRTPPANLGAVLIEQTEGNPLFVTELVRLLATEDRLEWAGAARGRAPVLPVPQTVREVIGRRLDLLSPACVRVLTLAAVTGREFALDVLAQLGELAGEDLLDVLEEAEAAHLIAAVAAIPGHYRFSHALVRETLYEEVPRARCVRLHRRVGEALESVYVADLTTHLAELAHHFFQALLGGDAAKAVAYARRAGDRARAQLAYEEAARHYETALRALELAGAADRSAQCDLFLAVAQMLLAAGQPQRVLDEAAPVALAAAEDLGDPGRAAQACWLAIDSLRHYGAANVIARPEYRAWVQRLDRFSLPGTADRVRADIALAELRLAAQHPGGWELFQRALRRARQLDDPDTLFAAAYAMINWLPAPRHEAERFRLAEEFSARPRHGVNARLVGSLLARSEDVYLGWGRREQAMALRHEVAAWAAHTRDASIRIRPLVDTVIYATLDGELEGAVEAGERLIVEADRLGMPLNGRLFAALRTHWPRLHLGRGDEILAAMDDFRQLAGVPERRIMLRDRKPHCLAHLGRVAEARAVLAETPEWHGTGPEAAAEVATQRLVLLLDTAVQLGDREAAAQLACRLAPAAAMAVTDISLTSIGRHLGAAAALLGDRAAARAHYTAALQLLSRLQFRPEIALTRLALAELLLSPWQVAGPRSVDATPEADRTEAMGHLEVAIAAFEAMKMPLALARARRLEERLPAAGQRPPAPGPAYPAGLTAREVEVLRLLAAGHTNREIAAALVLTVVTVQNHVASIYRKIDVHTRAEATAYAFRQGLAAASPRTARVD